jgi:uncharacterized protein YjbJ (UPF0337 family)
MNQDNISGKWKELKGEIRNQWGKLTDDEIERTKGNMQAISGLIQQRYGDAKEDSSDKLKSMFTKFGVKAEQKTEAGKEWMAKKSEDKKESLRRDRSTTQN